MKLTNELKTGLMVLFSIFLLVVMIVKVSDFSLESKGYHLKVLFDYSGGVIKNAPVRFAGVEVGKVNSVDIIYTNEGTHVQLDLLIAETAKIREDSRIYISTLGLMGEKYVEITPGTPIASFVSADSVLQGDRPLQVKEIVDNANHTLARVKYLTNNLNSLLADNKENIDSTINDFQITAINLKEFSEDIKAHPWRLFVKGKTKKKKIKNAKRIQNTSSSSRRSLID